MHPTILTNPGNLEKSINSQCMDQSLLIGYPNFLPVHSGPPWTSLQAEEPSHLLSPNPLDGLFNAISNLIINSTTDECYCLNYCCN